MPYDRKYDASTDGGGPDNVVGSDNNYERTTGATSKAGRLVSCWYKTIDGVGVGCRAWKALERETDTPTNRALLERYLEEALTPLVKSGEIKDLTIEVDDPATLKGVAALVTFTDVREGDTATLGVIAPWGR
jgi:phage gp46-like protein